MERCANCGHYKQDHTDLGTCTAIACGCGGFRPETGSEKGVLVGKGASEATRRVMAEQQQERRIQPVPKPTSKKSKGRAKRRR